MAKASGPAADGLVTGEFLHKTSGVHYRVYEQDSEVWMSYERKGKDEVRGQRELLYFVGSGKKGRTYLFSEGGYLFETPINWYSQEGRWNKTPAYTEAKEVPLSLPAFSSCLNCHGSDLQTRIPGTRNKFAGKPFAHNGITCERCHGAGETHMDGKGAIVNPVKLSSERRDGICMECHFEGTVAVQQPGKHFSEFRPGEKLSDYVHYFLWSESESKTAEGLSQFEALAQSSCKRKSGDRMWCGSCHDPHRQPAALEKAAYYRNKCLNCHGEAFAARHANKSDCTQCHMPALPSKDVAHTQTADHRILRNPTPEPVPQLQVRGRPLVSFPESDAPLASARDLALAWEMLAQRNVEGAAKQAEQYEEEAVKKWPDDAPLLSAIGFVKQKQGKQEEAREFYERA